MTDQSFLFDAPFSGLGGFRIAAESFGGISVFACDIDPDARKVYKANFGQEPQGDIREIREEDVRAHDVLCAGFDCKPFSLAGKRKGFKDKESGTLFFEINRIVEYRQPKVVFLENVKNLTSHDRGRTMAVMVQILEDAGYTVFPKVLNASDYGVPTGRERIYIVGFRKDLEVTNFMYPEPMNTVTSLADLVEPSFSGKTPDPQYEIHKPNTHIDWSKIPSDLRQRFNKPIQIGQIGKGGQGNRVYWCQGHAVTFSSTSGGAGRRTGCYFVRPAAPDGDRVTALQIAIAEGEWRLRQLGLGGIYKHFNGGKEIGTTLPYVLRRLTPEEALRIMGYPETYRLLPSDLTDNKVYKLIGNSVAIPVLKAIFERILATGVL